MSNRTTILCSGMESPAQPPATGLMTPAAMPCRQESTLALASPADWWGFLLAGAGSRSACHARDFDGTDIRDCCCLACPCRPLHRACKPFANFYGLSGNLCRDGGGESRRLFSVSQRPGRKPRLAPVHRVNRRGSLDLLGGRGTGPDRDESETLGGNHCWTVWLPRAFSWAAQLWPDSCWGGAGQPVGLRVLHCQPRRWP